jgi:RPA family protein
MAESNARIRATAYKLPILAMIKSPYVKGEAEFAPNFLQLEDKKVSRVNLIGVVVRADGPNSFVLDDGTGEISVRSFDQSPIPEAPSVGEIINVIGKPREFGSERYLVPEIIKKTAQEWMQVRKLEMAKISISPNQPEKEKAPEVEDIGLEAAGNILGKHEKVLSYIKDNDRGQGVDVEEIIKNLDINDCEGLVEEMLKEGNIFENLPGKLKVLE